MTKKILTISCITGFLLIAPFMYAYTGNEITGVWKVNKIKGPEKGKTEAKVRIYKCGNYYCGKFVWLEDADAIDNKNPDPSKKNRRLMGMTFMYGFIFDGANLWKNGKIYNAENGKVYDSKMWLTGRNKLNLKGGYKVGPVFVGASRIWIREK